MINIHEHDGKICVAMWPEDLALLVRHVRPFDNSDPRAMYRLGGIVRTICEALANSGCAVRMDAPTTIEQIEQGSSKETVP